MKVRTNGFVQKRSTICLNESPILIYEVFMFSKAQKEPPQTTHDNLSLAGQAKQTAAAGTSLERVTRVRLYLSLFTNAFFPNTKIQETQFLHQYTPPQLSYFQHLVS